MRKKKSDSGDLSKNETKMLEERVERHEMLSALQGPEIIGGQHRDPRQHAKATRAEPDPAPGHHQRRAAKFDDDGKARPEPTGT